MNKLPQVIPKSIIRCNKAFENFEKSYLDFAIELWKVKVSQDYREAGYDTFENFVFSRYQRRFRTAQHFSRIGKMAVQNNITRTDISLSNMRVIAPHIKKENKKELFAAARKMKYEELKEFVKKKLPWRPVVGRIVVNFYDMEVFVDVHLGMEIARRVNQSPSGQLALRSMAQEFLATHPDIANEISKDYNPVSLQVYIRDGWKCKCDRDECPQLYGPLHRHTIHPAQHKSATPDECITLSEHCHGLVTKNKAKVTLLAPGKIKYEVMKCER